MELRQMVSSEERELFGRCLNQARATKGLGFREKPGSKIGDAHLMFGDLYALLEEGAPAETMQAGFIVHSLCTLPQSVPHPDLSYLSAEQILEGGELWSLTPGAGRVARILSGAVAGIMQARAMIIYAIADPVNITGYYAASGFSNIGAPVKWPYAETLKGGDILVQPMIMEGAAMRQYVNDGFRMMFSVSGSGRVIRCEGRIENWASARMEAAVA